MKSERVENCWCGFEWCILNTQRVSSSNKFKIMKFLCNRWVFVRNPDTSKDIVRLVHEVHPVFAVTLSTFSTCYVGEMMIPCQLSSQRSFVVVFNFMVIISKILVNAWKRTNEVRKGWKLLMWLWMVHFEHTKSLEFKIMKSLCNRWVFVPNPDTSKEIVRFVHEVHPLFAVTLSTF